MKNRKIIIVGGGASGLVAAIAAARNGADVKIIEKKERLGKKILSTGNGRCNFTNRKMDADCFRSDAPEKIAPTLKTFGTDETLRFFEELGIIAKERQGYFYPRSDEAAAILHTLCMEIEKLAVSVCLNTEVTALTKKKSGFTIETMQTDTEKKKLYDADAVILATGGKAAPKLGSDGSGYPLAKSMGHSISPVVPSLVALRCEGKFFKQLAGVRTEAKVSAVISGKTVASNTGELQLTDYGISGIPVFQISRFVSKALYYKEEALAEIDFMPGMTVDAFAAFLKERASRHSGKTAEDFLVGIFHKKLIPVLLQRARIVPEQKVSAFSEKDWEMLQKVCRQFRVSITGTNPFEQAQVCAGGVRMDEINCETMESLYAGGLHLTGELLDVDGICGGYNLQWAWASGYIAGEHAAGKTERNQLCCESDN